MSELPLSYQNAFNGDTLELITNTVGGAITASKEYRTIEDYTVIPDGTTVESKVSADPILPYSFGITEDTSITNYYNGWSIIIGSEKRKILYYRGYDKRVFIDEPFTTAPIATADVLLVIDTHQVRISSPYSVELPLVAENDTLDDNTTYRIRSSAPVASGVLTAGSQTTFTLPATVQPMDYSGCKIWITSDPLVFNGALAGGGFIVDSTTFQAEGTFTLPAGASIFPDGRLEGMTILLTSGVFAGYEYMITKWDNATLTGTITPGWTHSIAGNTNPVAGDTFEIRQPLVNEYRTITSYDRASRKGTVSIPFSYTTLNGTNVKYAVGATTAFEILQFQADNYKPLDFTVSTVAQQNSKCYDVELISLTIPKSPIIDGYGGSITTYPFVYVEFANQTEQSTQHSISSNSSVINNNNILFIAPLTYNYISLSPFTLLDGHGMVQRVKFRLDDSYRFSVYLPNGDLLLTQNDWLDPSPPNPFLQITACFRVSRIS